MSILSTHSVSFNYSGEFGTRYRRANMVIPCTIPLYSYSLITPTKFISDKARPWLSNGMKKRGIGIAGVQGSLWPSRGSTRRDMLMRVTAEESATFATQENVSSPKTELLSVVAGLDRGLVANEADVMAADTAAKKLEGLGGIVDFSEGLDKLQGRWRLIYSSAFASGSLGGNRPGPPIGRLPLTLGQVFQRIDVVGRESDNIVDLQIGTPWPLPPIEVTATLAHSFEVIGGAKIRIIFERTIVRPAGGLSQLPPVELPQLPEIFRPPSSLRSGDFEVTFLDDDLRITRGDHGELRVFVKA